MPINAKGKFWQMKKQKKLIFLVFLNIVRIATKYANFEGVEMG